MKPDSEVAGGRPGWGLRALGVALIASSTLPIFRLVNTADDAYRRLSVAAVEGALAYMGSAALLAVLLGVVLTFLVPASGILSGLERIGQRIERIPLALWASGVGALAFLLGVFANRVVFRGLFIDVDEIASFLQAQYFTVGALAADLPASASHWLIPNMLVVDAGLVSQFPPSHLAFMALAETAGVVELMGPVLFGMLAVLAALGLPRLLPDTPIVARVGAVLVAISPFMVLLGGGALSHLSAGAFLWLAVYAALRARDGGGAWSVLAGAAVGVAVCSRPWIGLLLGTLATLGIWIPALVRARRDATDGGSEVSGIGMGWLFTRGLGTILGGVPFAAALAWYNTRLFGGPTTLGYLAAFGDRHKLGFHADPWGNVYTLRDAIGLTSADLVAFGEQLLESPIPVGVAIGVWLVLAARPLPRGTRFLLAWALVPVGANFIYWFHKTRMMYEGAPAWLALTALAVAPLFRARDVGEPRPGRSRLTARGVGLWTLVACGGLAVAAGIPDRAATFIWEDQSGGTSSAPRSPDGQPALIFVHTSWNERVSALLQGEGDMRQDSVMSAVDRNTSCELHTYAMARGAMATGGPTSLPELDLSQEPGVPVGITSRRNPDGAVIRTREGEVLTSECSRQIRADRFGSVALAPLLWQGDMPGLERDRPFYVRDLGPDRNQELVDLYADREAWVYVPTTPESDPRLVPYEEAMQVLWNVPTDPGGVAP